MPLLQAFQHPAVKIAVRLNDGFVDLLEQEIDVAVWLGDYWTAAWLRAVSD